MDNIMTIMYIHGYGSNGNATKGQLLRRMLPMCRVVSPTFDYDHCSPWQILEQIRDFVEKENVRVLVGSSFGGYMALCAMQFFNGTVWAINPVHDVVTTIERLIQNENENGERDEVIEMYKVFDQKVFRGQSEINRTIALEQSLQDPANSSVHRSLNFALSTDDELLGDHRPLLELFPHHDQVVWKNNSGHHFLRFDELAVAIASSIPSEA